MGWHVSGLLGADYALEWVDGQESKLLPKNYKCCIGDMLG